MSPTEYCSGNKSSYIVDEYVLMFIQLLFAKKYYMVAVLLQ